VWLLLLLLLALQHACGGSRRDVKHAETRSYTTVGCRLSAISRA